MEEKKVFEEPVVTKVEFDFNELITASGCMAMDAHEYIMDGCILTA